MSDTQKKQCIACAQPIYKDAKILPLVWNATTTT